MGTTAPLTIASLLSGTDLTLGQHKALRLDEVSERTALEQDVREKAAWDAVTAASKQRRMEFLHKIPHGWTVAKDDHGKRIYVSPNGRRQYGKPASSSACVLL